jgi:hypothetical protein
MVDSNSKIEIAKSKKTRSKTIDKYSGFKVPSKTTGPRPTKWVVHIYAMIKDANPKLLERDDVRTAFNNLVDCLMKYDGSFVSWCPTKREKYRSGIVLRDVKYSTLKGLPARFTYDYQATTAELRKKLQDESADIINTYMVLYDLIKRDVVPYMEKTDYELNSKKQIEYYRNLIANTEYEIKALEARINDHRKHICEYAKICLDLENPPKLTTFD